jgi:hypothetical protein
VVTVPQSKEEAMQPQKNLSRKDHEDSRKRLWLMMEPQQLQELLKELQMV